MKKIEILEEAAKNGTSYKDIDLVPTFGWAYFYSKQAGNRLLNFAEVIWERDVPAIIENCRRFGITDFTISSTYSGLLTTLAEFEKNGCHMVRLTEVNANYTEFTGNLSEEPKQAVIPALLMRIDKA